MCVRRSLLCNRLLWQVNMQPFWRRPLYAAHSTFCDQYLAEEGAARLFAAS